MKQDLDLKILQSLYAEMLRIRKVEERIADRYLDQEMRCPVHLSIGQEAIAVGVSSNLSNNDRAFSTHRCHAHYLAKGGNLNEMIAEIYGKETGCIGGRGGSMHLTDDRCNFHASIPIIGSSVPLALGTALSDKLDGNNNVSVCFFGDATIEEGVLHESLNFASVQKLPVLFVCENNFFSIYTNIKERQPKRPFQNVAASHNVYSESVDGNNVAAVSLATQSALKNIRAGNGPAILFFNTYRLREHCGPATDDHLGYRHEEEVKYWSDQCPIQLTLDKISKIEPGFTKWSENLNSEIEQEITKAFELAIASPLPTSDQAQDFVYA
jgi:TPP-dependent pyruvate/acetoin dehydrogenase alpha subunit